MRTRGRLDDGQRCRGIGRVDGSGRLVRDRRRDSGVEGRVVSCRDGDLLLPSGPLTVIILLMSIPYPVSFGRCPPMSCAS